MNGKTPSREWYEDAIARQKEDLAECEEELRKIEEWSTCFYAIHPIKNKRNLIHTQIDFLTKAYARDYFWQTVDEMRDI